MWFQSNKYDNKTFEDVLQRLANVESKLKGLEIENTDLRNKVLRKIQRLPSEEDSTLTPKTSNTKMFSPFM